MKISIGDNLIGIIILLFVLFFISPILIDLIGEIIDAWRNIFNGKRPF